MLGLGMIAWPDHHRSDVVLATVSRKAALRRNARPQADGGPFSRPSGSPPGLVTRARARRFSGFNTNIVHTKELLSTCPIQTIGV